ncbi:MAG: hypothetical protein ACI4T5_10375, partial [Prevotella sp.]
MKKFPKTDIPLRYRPSAIDCPIMQFQISKANGRVIGFFNHNHSVFYIVFLDPNHNAQLSGYNDYKVREIEPCKSEIDDLMARIAKHVELDSELAREAGDFFIRRTILIFAYRKSWLNLL